APGARPRARVAARSTTAPDAPTRSRTRDDSRPLERLEVRAAALVAGKRRAGQLRDRVLVPVHAHARAHGRDVSEAVTQRVALRRPGEEEMVAANLGLGLRGGRRLDAEHPLRTVDLHRLR